MRHEWFYLADDIDYESKDDQAQASKFSWRQLRRRNVDPPFGPDSASLAPPFRGQAVYDITHEVPLKFLEFQAARDQAERSSLRAIDADGAPWSGFVQVSREALVDAKVNEFKAHAKAIMHMESSMSGDEGPVQF
jgi:hypothetical protein